MPIEPTAPPSHLPNAPPFDEPTSGLVTSDLPDRNPTIPRYRIERELGRGGMGVVYLAHREGDATPVALKTITPAVVHSSGSVGRFLREAGVLRKLDHPNIVEFREIGQAGDRLYFVMEYVPGTDADGLVKGHRGPLPIARAVGLACQVLDGLSYAHARGFVHRDIKPKNILVETSGGRDLVKIADFGLARLYHSSPFSGLTIMGQAGGSPGFMPPEQVTNFREAKPPADLHGTGSMHGDLIAGRKVHDSSPNPDPQRLNSPSG